MTHYASVVVGGGMLGATTALGLAQQGRSVALLEAHPPAPFVADTPPDLRVSAIGISTVALLQRLGVWPAIAAMRLHAYRQVEVWEEGTSTVVTFSDKALGFPLLGYPGYLGYIVENRLLQLGIWQQFGAYENLDVYAPAILQQLHPCSEGWRLILNDGQVLTTSLVVGADGSHSQVRQLAGIGVAGWHYQQQCLLITVKPDQQQPEVTWQCFYRSGPRAFLPLAQGWGSLAWYDTPERVRQLQHMPLPQLTHAIEQAYPMRLGKVEVHAIRSFHLARQHAVRYYLSGLVLLGDAAHTIHPLAGQGANLGFRDVEALLAVLALGWPLASSRCDPLALLRYQQQRRTDNLLMQTVMDLLYKSFGSSKTLLPLLRNLALITTEHIPPLKRWILKYALGLLHEGGYTTPERHW